MGTGKSKSFAAPFALAFFVAAMPSWARTDYHSGIWNLLRAAHFDFADNGDSRAWLAGSIFAGGKRYEIWGYAWEETPETKAGSTQHAHYNVLMFEETQRGLFYRGAYDVDGVPFQVKGRTIKFQYPKSDVSPGYKISDLGDEIVFDDKGPPKKVRLNGELHQFDPADRHTGIWHVLETGHFGGIIDIDADIRPVGSIAAGRELYRIMGYTWHGVLPPGSDGAKFPRHRVLVFEETKKGLSYLGGYAVENVPFDVSGRMIKFHYPQDAVGKGFKSSETGDEIVFDNKGPPLKVHLRRDLREFGK